MRAGNIQQAMDPPNGRGVHHDKIVAMWMMPLIHCAAPGVQRPELRFAASAIGASSVFALKADVRIRRELIMVG